MSKSQYPTTAPASWGSRRAPGEIQLALSDLLQARARLHQALLNYDNLLSRINLAIESLDTRSQRGADAASIESVRDNTVRPLKVAAFAANQTKDKMTSIMESVTETVNAVVEGVPKSVGLSTDAFASVRAVLLNGKINSTAAIKTGYWVSTAVEEGSKVAIDEAKDYATSRLEGDKETYEIAQMLRQIETLIHDEAPLRAEAETLAETLRQQTGRYQAAVERGYRLLEERAAFRRNAAGDTQARRYQDMTFRVFRNDALQKYRAQFDLAARYTYLAAVAYDFETQLLGGTSGSGRESVTYGLNYFGWPLGGGDSAYDPTLFATKVRSVGVWFSNYDGHGLSQTPRVYLVPAGADVLRAPGGDDLALRFWRVLDQRLPVPFPIGSGNLTDPAWIPVNDSLSSTLEEPRRFSSFRAYHDSGSFHPSETISDSRLIGRSVWNTDWLLIIPGGTFLSDPRQGLEGFIQSVGDIKIFFQTYPDSGN